jgi:hypothetical protein
MPTREEHQANLQALDQLRKQRALTAAEWLSVAASLRAVGQTEQAQRAEALAAQTSGPAAGFEAPPPAATAPPVGGVMYCLACGQRNDTNNFRCSSCGAYLHPQPQAPVAMAPDNSTAVLGLIVPIGVSGWAIVASYLGCLSIFLLPAPLAIIAGFGALSHLKKNPSLSGQARAIFAIVMGALMTGLFVVMMVAGAVGGR